MDSDDQERPGAVRLLESPDLFKTNAQEKELVGWKAASQGYGGICNKHVGLAMLRIVVQKIIDGRLQDIYDQPLLVLNPGVIVVCRSGETVAFVRQFRFIGERLAYSDPNYVRHLQEEQRWEELSASLGKWQWELPGGIASLPEMRTWSQTHLINIAKAEAREEAGLFLDELKICGTFNPFPTFCAHPEYVVSGQVKSWVARHPEGFEMVERTAFFTATEIRRMVDAGELQDGLTLSALAIAGIHF